MLVIEFTFRGKNYTDIRIVGASGIKTAALRKSNTLIIAELFVFD